jgi:rhamnopyranosyl-N-acetylglucosaminyl-diphospho-decaprenol beta-1,3/1,4-galactofuranosyltransferase
MTVAAFVITRNRKQIVGRAIESILNQTLRPDAVWVIDNGSTDGTDTVVESFGSVVHFCRLGANTGSAGGFHAACALALENGYDWAWFLDDDGLADPECLETLLARARAEAGICAAVPLKRTAHDEIVESYVVWRPDLRKPGKPDPASYSKPLFDIDYTGTCGLMVSRLAIKTAGLPLKDLFFGFDDYEYCHRLRKFGRIVVVTDATVRHPAHPPRTPDQSFWRRYYAIRNSLYLRLYGGRPVFPNTKILGILGLALADCCDGLTRRGSRMRNLRIVLTGVRDGLLGRLGAGPAWLRP